MSSLERGERFACSSQSGVGMSAGNSKMPGTPRDEEAMRLLAVHRLGILDTPAESAYDAITRLAADYFEADSAVISFADETRVWVKSHWGEAIRELPRANSIFDMVREADGPLVVPDIRCHPGFQGQKLHLRTLNVVFLAAAPVRTTDGEVVGILLIC